MKSPEEELNNPDYDDFSSEFIDPDTKEMSLAPWYISIRAVEEFRTTHSGVYPGIREEDIEGNFLELRTIVDKLMVAANPY